MVLGGSSNFALNTNILPQLIIPRTRVEISGMENSELTVLIPNPKYSPAQQKYSTTVYTAHMRENIWNKN